MLDAAAVSLGTAADGISVREVVLTAAVTEDSAEFRVLVSMLVAAVCEASFLVAVRPASLVASLVLPVVVVVGSPERCTEVEALSSSS